LNTPRQKHASSVVFLSVEPPSDDFLKSGSICRRISTASTRDISSSQNVFHIECGTCDGLEVLCSRFKEKTYRNSITASRHHATITSHIDDSRSTKLKIKGSWLRFGVPLARSYQTVTMLAPVPLLLPLEHCSFITMRRSLRSNIKMPTVGISA
jgi:hypothetical protein